jgi:hypothetical protein
VLEAARIRSEMMDERDRRRNTVMTALTGNISKPD